MTEMKAGASRSIEVSVFAEYNLPAFIHGVSVTVTHAIAEKPLDLYYNTHPSQEPSSRRPETCCWRDC